MCDGGIISACTEPQIVTLVANTRGKPAFTICGIITPPVGPTLFVGCAIGKVTMEQVSKELWPFYGAMCLALLLVTYVPAISLWAPGLMK